MRKFALIASAAVVAATACVSASAYAQTVDATSDVDECNGERSLQIAACGGGAARSIDGVTGATAFGTYAYAQQGGTAIGNRANSSGEESVAVGKDTYAEGDYSITVGSGAQSAGFAGIAIGTSSDAQGNSALAVGNNVTAGHDNTVVIGRNTTSNYANQVKIGAADQNYTLGGINNALSKSRQSGTTYFVTSDVNGNLATTTFDIGAQQDLIDDVAGIQLVVTQHETQLTEIETQLTEMDMAIFEANENAYAAQLRANQAFNSAAAAQATADQAAADNLRQDAEIVTAQSTANNAIARSNALGAATASALGGGSTYDDVTGTLSAPSYAIGGQLYDNVGAAFEAVDDRIDQVETRVDVLAASQGRRFRHANGGIAAAMALGGTMIVPDSTVSLSFNLATYRGEQGFSGTVAVRAAPRIYVSGGFAGSTVGGSTGGRVGMAIGF